MSKELNPNTITFFRFFFGIIMIYFAFFKNREFFFMSYAFALITDILDGFVARKYKKETHKGKILDILADNFILVCLFIGFLLMKKVFILAYKPHLIFILSYYFFVQIISFIFTSKFIFKRTIAANIAAIIFPFLIFFMFFFDLNFLVYPYLIFMIFSLSEKLILTLANEDRISLFLIKSNVHKIFLFFIVILMTFFLFLLTGFSENYFFEELSNKTLENNNIDSLNPSSNDYLEVCFENSKCIIAEVRDNDSERILGLMYRENINESFGMLFVFDSNVDYAFWMKNMKFNIDIIFIDENKTIVSIVKGAFPCNKPDNECELYFSKKPYKYVIEVTSGFTNKYDIFEGQKVFFEFNLSKK